MLVPDRAAISVGGLGLDQEVIGMPDIDAVDDSSGRERLARVAGIPRRRERAAVLVLNRGALNRLTGGFVIKSRMCSILFSDCLDATDRELTLLLRCENYLRGSSKRTGASPFTLTFEDCG